MAAFDVPVRRWLVLVLSVIGCAAAPRPVLAPPTVYVSSARLHGLDAWAADGLAQDVMEALFFRRGIEVDASGDGYQSRGPGGRPVLRLIVSRPELQRLEGASEQQLLEAMEEAEAVIRLEGELEFVTAAADRIAAHPWLSYEPVIERPHPGKPSRATAPQVAQRRWYPERPVGDLRVPPGGPINDPGTRR